jgi:hypothetical protein
MVSGTKLKNTYKGFTEEDVNQQLGTESIKSQGLNLTIENRKMCLFSIPKLVRYISCIL